MKKECVAMLLAGGQGSRLYVLTGSMAKPAVPFGGKFRIIDFPLSNCTNSGIDTVGVLTQYRPLELNTYIGSGQPWELDRVNGGVHILPPYQSAGGAVIEAGAKVSYAIVGEGCRVGRNAVVGGAPGSVPFEDWGIAVLGPRTSVADGAVIEPKMMLGENGKEVRP